MKAGTTKRPKSITASALFMPRLWALAYLFALAIAEILTAWVAPLAGLVLHSLIFGALLLHASLGAQGRGERFLLSLALVPLIRLLSLTIPFQQFPTSLWHLLIGVPLSAGVYLAARQGRFTVGMLGLTWRRLPVQIAIGLAGIGLGYLEYQIIRPDPLIPEFRFLNILAMALILLLFTGLLEEVIFRGVIQYAATQTLGRSGFLYSIAIFTLLHLGYHSLKELLFIAGVAICFTWIVSKSGSIVGTSLAHGLTNICLFLVFPFLLASPINTSTAPIDILSPAILNTPRAAATPTPVPAASPAVQQEVVQTLLPTPGETTTMMIATSTPTIETLVPTSTETAALPNSTSSPTIQTPTVLPPVEPPTSEPGEKCGPPSGWVIYIVRPGDTLYSLSRIYGVSVSQIQAANCLGNGNRIFAGQQLWVPFLLPLPTATLYPTTAPTFTVTPLAPTATPVPPTIAPTETAGSPVPLDTPTSAPTETRMEPAAEPTTSIPAETPTEALPTEPPPVDIPQP